jgi:hypothetical protein
MGQGQRQGWGEGGDLVPPAAQRTATRHEQLNGTPTEIQFARPAEEGMRGVVMRVIGRRTGLVFTCNSCNAEEPEFPGLRWAVELTRDAVTTGRYLCPTCCQDLGLVRERLGGYVVARPPRSIGRPA